MEVRLLAIPLTSQLRAVWRPLLASTVLFASATWARGAVQVDGWAPLVLLGSLSGAVALLLAYGMGLRASQRRAVRSRVMKVVRPS